MKPEDIKVGMILRTTKKTIVALGNAPFDKWKESRNFTGLAKVMSIARDGCARCCHFPADYGVGVFAPDDVEPATDNEIYFVQLRAGLL
jgi:hypothetical protein